MSEQLLEMRNIKKSFGATRALSGVSIDLRSGEVHAFWRKRRRKINPHQHPRWNRAARQRYHPDKW